MSVDVQGVDSFRRVAAVNPQLKRAMVTVFIVVDHERLMARMRYRGQDNEAEIARRMATAEAELREADTFDYRIESRTRDEDFTTSSFSHRGPRAPPPARVNLLISATTAKGVGPPVVKLLRQNDPIPPEIIHLAARTSLAPNGQWLGHLRKSPLARCQCRR